MNELIQWPRAKYWTTQWNPVIGCKPCSPACGHCYAAAWAERFGQSFEPHESSQTRPPRKGIVFCGNITDLFGEWMWPHKGSYIMKSPADLIAKCDSCDATYLWLTKRVDRLTLELSVGEIPRMNEEGIVECVRLSQFAFPNHYFGFTAENQEWYEKRMSIVNECFPKWANLWISAEPLLGPIDFRWDDVVIKPKVVITGCESGPNRRPCKIEWVESIVEQCRAANVPVFVKQVCLEDNKFTNKIEEFPPHLQIRQVPWAKEGFGSTPKKQKQKKGHNMIDTQKMGHPSEMQVGNEAKLRETLVAVKKSIDEIGASSLDGDPEILMMSLTQVLARLSARIDAALSAPPRNCDVGTADEQAERYGRYCDKFTSGGMHCETCPCCGKIQFGKCEFAWAQMSYEEGGAK